MKSFGLRTIAAAAAISSALFVSSAVAADLPSIVIKVRRY